MPVKFKVNNLSGLSDDKIFIRLHSDTPATASIASGSDIALNTLTNNSFTITSISSGRIYFSYENALGSSNPDPNTIQTRYDKVELTIPGNPSTVNLTYVDFFGIPFTLQNINPQGEITDTFACYLEPSKLIDDLANQSSNGSNKLTTSTGEFLRVLAPVKTPAPDTAFFDFLTYVKTLVNWSFTIKGQFFGNTKKGLPAAAYNFTGNIDKTGTITLSPNISGDEKIVLNTNLSTTIWLCNGAYTVGKRQGSFDDNDKYSAAVRDLLSAFNFGYMGSSNVNASDSTTWWAVAPYSGANTGQTFNPYAQEIFKHTDSYGFPFSDARGKQRSVQLHPEDGDTVEITILPDDNLSAPTMATITPNNQSIDLTWGAVANATSYTVRVGTTTHTTSNTSFTVPNLNPGTPYTIYVSATNGTLTSAERKVKTKTTGTLPIVSGAYKFQATFFFNNDAIQKTCTVNGVSITVPKNMAKEFQLSGVPNAENQYAFSLDTTPPFDSVLKITLPAVGNDLDVNNISLENSGGTITVSGTGTAIPVQPL